jgi:Protein of unknown function (DUF3619)
MNRNDIHTMTAHFGSEASQLRFARNITSHLTQHTKDLSPDISERLRVGREQALAAARLVRARQSVVVDQSLHLGTVLAWFGGDLNFDRWFKLSSILPLVALLLGLLAIQDFHGNNEISATADIDSSLLADDLPPSAYSDKGFLEFLKSPPRE